MPAAPTILVVDDEPSIRTYIRNILRIEGFDLLEASDGLDALQQIEQRAAPIDLLLTDIRMPRMDGVALARSVAETHPHTPVLYISGYPFDVEEERAQQPIRACGFVAKPFTRKALVEAIWKCLQPQVNVGRATSSG